MELKDDTEVLLDSGDEYLWRKGVTLQTTERCGFIIPGRILEGMGGGLSMGDLMEISDEETQVFPISPEGTEFPDFAVILEPNVTMKLNRNCGVIHAHLKGEKPKKKKFIKLN